MARLFFSSPAARVPDAAVLAIVACAAAWAFTAWLALDMSTPLAALTMPDRSGWTRANVAAVFLMWAAMMAAMMLPSAWPIIRLVAQLGSRPGERARSLAFVLAYLFAWSGFSALATALQWALQRAGWIDPMAASRSTALTGVLLLVAGAYQWSPLKHVCLAACRSPLGFIIGEWRPGVAGAWRMGMRHGALCVGCCWALMMLLFIGGAMNLPWVVALAAAVALEKVAPGGDRIGRWFGGVLLVVGFEKLLVAAFF